MRNKYEAWREFAKRKSESPESSSPSVQPAQIVDEQFSGDTLRIFRIVRKIVKKQLDVEDNEVLMSSTFIEDLGADSLDIVELIMAFEEEFNIEIPDEQAEKIKTIGDAVNFVVYGR